MFGPTAYIGIILFLTIVAPLWIVFHYITRWRQSKTMTKEDEIILRDLYQTAERMEARVANLERILDAEAPGWRSKPHE